MKIETYIDSLVSYAMNNGFAEPVDHMVGRLCQAIVHGIGYQGINIGFNLHIRFLPYTASTPPSGRMDRMWQAPSPRAASIPALKESRISKGTKAWTVPAKPPPWTR